jgi:hypothetical protein
MVRWIARLESHTRYRRPRKASVVRQRARPEPARPAKGARPSSPDGEDPPEQGRKALFSFATLRAYVYRFSMNYDAAVHHFLKTKIQDFENDMHYFKRRVQSSGTVRELVQIAKLAPVPGSQISWSPEARHERAAGMRAVEKRAGEVVERELHRLEELHARVTDSEFQRELADFRRWLRYLGPLASSVARDANRQVHARWVKTLDEDSPATSRRLDAPSG